METSNRAVFERALERISPFSIIALLATPVLLFSFQDEAIVQQPLVIGILAMPILLQALFIAALGYGLNRRLRVRHDVAGPRRPLKNESGSIYNLLFKREYPSLLDGVYWVLIDPITTELLVFQPMLRLASKSLAHGSAAPTFRAA
jgi:hypothetical protein